MTTDLKESLIAIFPKADYVELVKMDRGFDINIGAMYESPDINFTTLKQVSVLFGTEEIDVDDFANTGCDTCDFGSNYGHEIHVYNPTLNNELFSKMCGYLKGSK